jgi:hypothetical protein
VKVPGVIIMIRKTTITGVALAAVAVLAAGCGSTTGQNTGQRSVPSQPKATQPAYDTAKFEYVITAGPEAIAFRKEQPSFGEAMNAVNQAAVLREAPHLIRTANAYLAVLRATNPEPKWQGVKEHLIRAVTENRNEAQDAADAVRDQDGAKMDEALHHAQVAAHQYVEAGDEARAAEESS